MDAILSSTVTDQDGEHDTDQDSDQVKCLISLMDKYEYTLAELMSLLGLSHRATFQKN